MRILATSESSPATASNQNLLGAIAYLGGFVTGVILLVVEKKNDYVRFHAMQSTIFSLGLFIIMMALQFVPYFGALASWAIQLGAFIVWIVLLWKSFNGERYKLPYVGELAEKQLAKMK